MAIKIIKLPNGSVVYDVYVNIMNVHGRRAQRKRRVGSLFKAREAETLLKAELLMEKGRPERATWGLWLTKILREMKITHRPSTVENYTLLMGSWVTPKLKDRFLDDLTPSDIHDVIYGRERKASPNTQRTVLDIVRRILGRAVEDGLLVRNPAIPVKVKVPQPKQTVLNAKEVQKLLYEAKSSNHRFYPIWATALFTGMRSGELYALKWTDIDFENRRIYVTRSWNNKAGYGPTKSQRNRVVPISDNLKKLLSEFALTKGERPPGEDFVLPHLQEWTDGEQAAVLRRFCDRIGITSVKFHDLRATFITQLLLKGAPLAQVMSMAGHTELKTTNGYLRVAGTDLDGATERLSYALPDVQLAEVLEFRPQVNG